LVTDETHIKSDAENRFFGPKLLENHTILDGVLINFHIAATILFFKMAAIATIVMNMLSKLTFETDMKK